jgi:hypothetical protein
LLEVAFVSLLEVDVAVFWVMNHTHFCMSLNKYSMGLVVQWFVLRSYNFWYCCLTYVISRIIGNNIKFADICILHIVMIKWYEIKMISYKKNSQC